MRLGSNRGSGRTLMHIAAMTGQTEVFRKMHVEAKNKNPKDEDWNYLIGTLHSTVLLREVTTRFVN